MRITPKSQGWRLLRALLFEMHNSFWGGAHRYTHDVANQELSVATKQYQPKK
jgi:hypothetical protein